eukprot:m51a1_g8529 hypothetical protein (5200) ;mRNA; r:131945-149050
MDGVAWQRRGRNWASVSEEGHTAIFDLRPQSWSSGAEQPQSYSQAQSQSQLPQQSSSGFHCDVWCRATSQCADADILACPNVLIDDWWLLTRRCVLDETNLTMDLPTALQCPAMCPAGTVSCFADPDKADFGLYVEARACAPSVEQCNTTATCLEGQGLCWDGRCLWDMSSCTWPPCDAGLVYTRSGACVASADDATACPAEAAVLCEAFGACVARAEQCPCAEGSHWCPLLGGCVAPPALCPPECPANETWCHLSNECLAPGALCAIRNGTCEGGNAWCNATASCIPDSWQCNTRCTWEAPYWCEAQQMCTKGWWQCCEQGQKFCSLDNYGGCVSTETPCSSADCPAETPYFCDWNAQCIESQDACPQPNKPEATHPCIVGPGEVIPAPLWIQCPLHCADPDPVFCGFNGWINDNIIVCGKNASDCESKVASYAACNADNGGFVCWDGRCTHDYNGGCGSPCPEGSVVCRDLSCTDNLTACPACPDGQTRCPDASCLPAGLSCDPCEAGYTWCDTASKCIAEGAECPYHCGEGQEWCYLSHKCYDAYNASCEYPCPEGEWFCWSNRRCVSDWSHCGCYPLSPYWCNDIYKCVSSEDECPRCGWGHFTCWDSGSPRCVEDGYPCWGGSSMCYGNERWCPWLKGCIPYDASCPYETLYLEGRDYIPCSGNSSGRSSTRRGTQCAPSCGHEYLCWAGYSDDYLTQYNSHCSSSYMCYSYNNCSMGWPCWDGSCTTNSSCPVPSCGDGGVLCYDSSCADSVAQCPGAPACEPGSVLCPGGWCAANASDCEETYCGEWSSWCPSKSQCMWHGYQCPWHCGANASWCVVTGTCVEAGGVCGLPECHEGKVWCNASRRCLAPELCSDQCDPYHYVWCADNATCVHNVDLFCPSVCGSLYWSHANATCTLYPTCYYDRPYCPALKRCADWWECNSGSCSPDMQWCTNLGRCAYPYECYSCPAEYPYCTNLYRCASPQECYSSGCKIWCGTIDQCVDDDFLRCPNILLTRGQDLITQPCVLSESMTVQIPTSLQCPPACPPNTVSCYDNPEALDFGVYLPTACAASFSECNRTCPEGKGFCWTGQCVSSMRLCPFPPCVPGQVFTRNGECTTPDALPECPPTAPVQCLPLGGSCVVNASLCPCSPDTKWCPLLDTCIAASDYCPPDCPPNQTWCHLSNQCVRDGEPCTVRNGTCLYGKAWCDPTASCLPGGWQCNEQCTQQHPFWCEAQQSCTMGNDACCPLGTKFCRVDNHAGCLPPEAPCSSADCPPEAPYFCEWNASCLADPVCPGQYSSDKTHPCHVDSSTVLPAPLFVQCPTPCSGSEPVFCAFNGWINDNIILCGSNASDCEGKVAEYQSCTADGGFVCWDGRCMHDGCDSPCPDGSVVCRDLSCADNLTSCPACAANYKDCGNNSCVPESWACEPCSYGQRWCSSMGACIAEAQQCPYDCYDNESWWCDYTFSCTTSSCYPECPPGQMFCWNTHRCVESWNDCNWMCDPLNPIWCDTVGQCLALESQCLRCDSGYSVCNETGVPRCVESGYPCNQAWGYCNWDHKWCPWYMQCIPTSALCPHEADTLKNRDHIPCGSTNASTQSTPRGTQCPPACPSGQERCTFGELPTVYTSNCYWPGSCGYISSPCYMGQPCYNGECSANGTCPAPGCNSSQVLCFDAFCASSVAHCPNAPQCPPGSVMCPGGWCAANASDCEATFCGRWAKWCPSKGGCISRESDCPWHCAVGSFWCPELSRCVASVAQCVLPPCDEGKVYCNATRRCLAPELCSDQCDPYHYVWCGAAGKCVYNVNYYCPGLCGMGTYWSSDNFSCISPSYECPSYAPFCPAMMSCMSELSCKYSSCPSNTRYCEWTDSCISYSQECRALPQSSGSCTSDEHFCPITSTCVAAGAECPCWYPSQVYCPLTGQCIDYYNYEWQCRYQEDEHYCSFYNTYMRNISRCPYYNDKDGGFGEANYCAIDAKLSVAIPGYVQCPLPCPTGTYSCVGLSWALLVLNVTQRCAANMTKCAVPCPGMEMCYDRTCSNSGCDGSPCADDQFIGRDLKCYASKSALPPCPSQYPYLCSHGSCAVDAAHCPSCPNGFYLCPSSEGGCIPVNETCPMQCPENQTWCGAINGCIAKGSKCVPLCGVGQAFCASTQQCLGPSEVCSPKCNSRYRFFCPWTGECLEDRSRCCRTGTHFCSKFYTCVPDSLACSILDCPADKYYCEASYSCVSSPFDCPMYFNELQGGTPCNSIVCAATAAGCPTAIAAAKLNCSKGMIPCHGRCQYPDWCDSNCYYKSYSSYSSYMPGVACRNGTCAGSIEQCPGCPQGYVSCPTGTGRRCALSAQGCNACGAGFTWCAPLSRCLNSTTGQCPGSCRGSTYWCDQNNQCIGGNSSCGIPCPSNKYWCSPTGMCTDNCAWNCGPHQPYYCWSNGQCVADASQCLQCYNGMACQAENKCKQWDQPCGGVCNSGMYYCRSLEKCLWNRWDCPYYFEGNVSDIGYVPCGGSDSVFAVLRGTECPPPCAYPNQHRCTFGNTRITRNSSTCSGGEWYCNKGCDSSSVLCSDGSCVPRAVAHVACPPPCPAGTASCYDGSCADSIEECPSHTPCEPWQVMCPGGQCVDSNASCSFCGSYEDWCDSIGECLPRGTSCPERCAAGLVWCPSVNKCLDPLAAKCPDPTCPSATAWCPSARKCLGVTERCDPSCTSALPLWCDATLGCVATRDECPVCPTGTKYCGTLNSCQAPTDICPACPGDAPYMCVRYGKCMASRDACLAEGCQTPGEAWCQSRRACQGAGFPCPACVNPTPLFCDSLGVCVTNLSACPIPLCSRSGGVWCRSLQRCAGVNETCPVCSDSMPYWCSSNGMCVASRSGCIVCAAGTFYCQQTATCVASAASCPYYYTQPTAWAPCGPVYGNYTVYVNPTVQQCPALCPAGTVRCNDRGFVKEAGLVCRNTTATCPPRKCADGYELCGRSANSSCVIAGRCPMPCPGMILCRDGMCTTSWWMCPSCPSARPIDCGNGWCVTDKSKCSVVAPPRQFWCDYTHTWVPEGTYCPWTCAAGKVWCPLINDCIYATASCTARCLSTETWCNATQSCMPVGKCDKRCTPAKPWRCDLLAACLSTLDRCTAACASGEQFCASIEKCQSTYTVCPNCTSAAAPFWCATKGICVADTLATTCPDKISCDSSSFWCASSQSCVAIGGTCKSCADPYAPYWCDVLGKCTPSVAQCSTTACPAGSVWCRSLSRCALVAEYCPNCTDAAPAWCANLQACATPDKCPVCTATAPVWCAYLGRCVGAADACPYKYDVSPAALYRPCFNRDGSMFVAPLLTQCPVPCDPGKRQCTQGGALALAIYGANACSTNGTCPVPPCPAGQVFCTDRLCHDAAANCSNGCPAARGLRCRDGSCVINITQCPATCPTNTTGCPDRSCVVQSARCTAPCGADKQFCPRYGSCQPSGAFCPGLCAANQRWCGALNRCVATADPCGTAACPNGTAWCDAGKACMPPAQCNANCTPLLPFWCDSQRICVASPALCKTCAQGFAWCDTYARCVGASERCPPKCTAALPYFCAYTWACVASSADCYDARCTRELPIWCDQSGNCVAQPLDCYYASCGYWCSRIARCVVSAADCPGAVPPTSCAANTTWCNATNTCQPVGSRCAFSNRFCVDPTPYYCPATRRCHESADLCFQQGCSSATPYWCPYTRSCVAGAQCARATACPAATTACKTTGTCVVSRDAECRAQNCPLGTAWCTSSGACTPEADCKGAAASAACPGSQTWCKMRQKCVDDLWACPFSFPPPLEAQAGRHACLAGSSAAENAQCLPPCPDNAPYRCPVSGKTTVATSPCVASAEFCPSPVCPPASPFLCADGSCAANEAACVKTSCPATNGIAGALCGDGHCESSGLVASCAACPSGYIDCGGGRCVQGTTCPDLCATGQRWCAYLGRCLAGTKACPWTCGGDTPVWCGEMNACVKAKTLCQMPTFNEGVAGTLSPAHSVALGLPSSVVSAGPAKFFVQARTEADQNLNSTNGVVNATASRTARVTARYADHGRFVIEIVLYEPGTVSLAVTLNGAAISGSPFSIAVTPAAAPSMLSAELAPSGAFIKIRFDSDTDSGVPLYPNAVEPSVTARSVAALTCEALFAGEATLWGAGATCAFGDPRTLVVTLGSSPGIRVGDTITLNSGHVRGCTQAMPCYTWSASGSVALTTADSYPPTAALQAPPGVPRCGAAKLRISGRASKAGSSCAALAPTLTYTWSATFDNGTAPGANVSAAVEAANAQSLDELGLDVMTMLADTLYRISLVVSDCSGAVSAAATATTQALGDISAPEVFVRDKGADATGRRVQLGQPVFLEASVKLSPCSTLSASAATFAWTRVSGPSDAKFVDASARSTSATVSAAGSYKFRVFVSLSFKTGNPVTATDTVVINVVQSAPVAAIAGGNRMISASQELVMDGSASRVAGGAALRYSWGCDDVFWDQRCVDGDGNVLALPAVPSFTLPARKLSQSLYKFSLNVSIEGSNDSDLLSSAAVKIIVTAPVEVLPPVVSVAALALAKISASKSISLVGTAISPSALPLTRVWTCVEGGLAMDPANFDTPLTALTLSIRPGVLADGKQYTFRLTARDSLNGIGYSEASFVTNSPPSGGGFSVSPASGRAALDTFTMAVDDKWADDKEDTPFSYSYSAVYPDGTVVYLKPPSPSQTVALPLSLPNGTESPVNITIVARIIDTWGAAAQASAVVTVAPVQFNASGLSSLVGSAMSALTTTGDVYVASTTLGAVAQSLGSASSASTEQKREIREQLAAAASDVVTSAIGATATVDDTVYNSFSKILEDMTSAPTELSAAVLDKAISALELMLEAATNENVSETGAPADAVQKFQTMLDNLLHYAGLYSGNETFAALFEARLNALMAKLSRASLSGKPCGHKPITANSNSLAQTGIRGCGDSQGEGQYKTGKGTSVDIPAGMVSHGRNKRGTAPSDYQIQLSTRFIDSVPVTGTPYAAAHSHVLKVSVKDLAGNEISITGIPNGIILNLTEVVPIGENYTAACVWLNEQTGNWSSDGCTVVASVPGRYTICNCSHLTQFSLARAKTIEEPPTDVSSSSSVPPPATPPSSSSSSELPPHTSTSSSKPPVVAEKSGSSIIGIAIGVPVGIVAVVAVGAVVAVVVMRRMGQKTRPVSPAREGQQYEKPRSAQARQPSTSTVGVAPAPQAPVDEGPAKPPQGPWVAPGPV